jgi:hypothetical protein
MQEQTASRTYIGAERSSYVPRAVRVGQQIFQHAIEAIITCYLSIT